MCAAVTSFATVMIGYDSAFIGGTLALPSFVNEFEWNTSKVNPQKTIAELTFLKANFVSLYQAGAFFGAFFAYPAGHYLGRQKGLTIFSGIFILGAGLMLGANGQRGLGLIYDGRVLAGIGVGAASNLTPSTFPRFRLQLFVKDLLDFTNWDGRWVDLLGFGSNMELALPSYHHTHNGSSHLPFNFHLREHSSLDLFSSKNLQESVFIVQPMNETNRIQWLFSKGRRDLALKNLAWMRYLPLDHIYMQEEISAINNAIEHQQSTVMWRFFLGGALFFWQNGSGTNTSLLTTGVFSVIKTVLTFVWLLYLIDHLGRRKPPHLRRHRRLLYLWYVGGYIAVAKHELHTRAGGGFSSGGISAMFFFYLWAASYTPSWNGTPWVLNSDAFDHNVRILAQAFPAGIIGSEISSFARFNPQAFITIGYGVYFLFVSLVICSVFFAWFLIPETKGIPLEYMDRLFAVQPPRKAHEIVVAELREFEDEFRNAGLRQGDLSAEKH